MLTPTCPNGPRKSTASSDEHREVDRGHDDRRSRVAERVEDREELAHGGNRPDPEPLGDEGARRLGRGRGVERSALERASRREGRASATKRAVAGIATKSERRMP